MFIGRTFEIEQLNRLYSRTGFQFAILYGRRKVGKTSLIKEFSKDKPTLFYVPEEHSETLAFNSFKKMIHKSFNLTSTTPVSTWEDAFKIICTESRNKKMVLVLDEFPSLVQENPSISSIIQKVIESQMKSSQIFLILSGSSNSLMEKQLLNAKNALYGLRTAQFKIEPFDFFHSAKFFPNIPMEEKIKYYSTLGGMPQYLSQFDYSKSYGCNIVESLLNKSSYLFGEPESYLRTRLENLNTANKILSLLSRGDFNLDRLNEKSFFMGEDLVTVIKKLKELSIIGWHKSVGRSERRPWSFYRLEDNFFRFWYRFLYKNRNLVDMGMLEYLFQNKINRDLHSHIGYIFESICTQFLIKLNSNFELPFVFETIGSWVGYNPLLKKPSQMDIVCCAGDSALIGECKWNSTPVSVDTLESLIQKAQTLQYNYKHYCFFSRVGFSDSALNYSLSNKNVHLYTLKDMERVI